MRTDPPPTGGPANDPLGIRILRWLFPPRYGHSRIARCRGYALLALALLIVLGGIFAGPQAVSRWRCGQLSISAGIWYDGGECVGVTDGSYAFGAGQAMTDVSVVNQQNKCHASQTPPIPVTIGAMVSIGATNSGVRALHEIEGFAAGVYEANLPSSNITLQCKYRLHLLIAQMGAQEQASVAIARTLVADGAVAVLGFGLSSQQTADAITVLNGDSIPMIADTLTGEGFDQNGSADDHLNYSQCQSASTIPGAAPYWSHIWSYFFRVSYRTATQVTEVLNYVDSHPDPKRQYFIVQPTDTRDPYTCSLVPLIDQGMTRRGLPTPTPLDFDTVDPQATQDSAATRICQATGPVTVYYAARGVYLSPFLDDLTYDKDNNECSPTSLTIVSQSDASQLRVPSLLYEPSREHVLSSSELRGGWLRIYYTPLADPGLIQATRPTDPGYVALPNAFAQLSIPRQDLDDGWAIMSRDTVATVASALQNLTSPPSAGVSNQPVAVTGTAIQAQIINLFGARSKLSAPGADGPIQFDGSGNRVGPGPGVVRLCPDNQPATTPPSTVRVTPGQTGSCPG